MGQVESLMAGCSVVDFSSYVDGPRARAYVSALRSSLSACCCRLGCRERACAGDDFTVGRCVLE